MIAAYFIGNAIKHTIQKKVANVRYFINLYPTYISQITREKTVRLFTSSFALFIVFSLILSFPLRDLQQSQHNLPQRLNLKSIQPRQEQQQQRELPQ